MKQIPITKNFDCSKSIGYAIIDEKELPEDISSITFSIGYDEDKDELLEISMIPDLKIKHRKEIK
jgi:hypothetical protein